MTSSRGTTEWWTKYVHEHYADEDDNTTVVDMLSVSGEVMATLNEEQYNEFHEDFVEDENGGHVDTSQVYDELHAYLIVRAMRDVYEFDPFLSEFIEEL